MALFFTYGNSPLLATHLPAVPRLVSHGLPCTSVQRQDGERQPRVRHLRVRERDEKLQLWSTFSGPQVEVLQNCKVAGIILLSDFYFFLNRWY